MTCTCGAPLEPDARFCGSCGARVGKEAVLPRPVVPDPNAVAQQIVRAEASLRRDEEKAGAPGPDGQTQINSPSTVYGGPQMGWRPAADVPPPPPPVPPPSPATPGTWTPPSARGDWGIPPGPQHSVAPPPPVPWTQSPPAVAPPPSVPWTHNPPAPVYGGPPAFAASPPATVPMRILMIPALGTLCGVGIGAALTHDVVGIVIGGLVAGAAAVFHASRQPI